MTEQIPEIWSAILKGPHRDWTCIVCLDRGLSCEFTVSAAVIYPYDLTSSVCHYCRPMKFDCGVKLPPQQHMSSRRDHFREPQYPREKALEASIVLRDSSLRVFPVGLARGYYQVGDENYQPNDIREFSYNAQTRSKFHEWLERMFSLVSVNESHRDMKEAPCMDLSWRGKAVALRDGHKWRGFNARSIEGSTTSGSLITATTPDQVQGILGRPSQFRRRNTDNVTTNLATGNDHPSPYEVPINWNDFAFATARISSHVASSSDSISGSDNDDMSLENTITSIAEDDQTVVNTNTTTAKISSQYPSDG